MWRFSAALFCLLCVENRKKKSGGKAPHSKKCGVVALCCASRLTLELIPGLALILPTFENLFMCGIAGAGFDGDAVVSLRVAPCHVWFPGLSRAGR